MPSAVTEWAPAILPTISFALLLFIPGGVLLWGAGMRVRSALLLAPLASAALAGAGGVALSIVGIPWNPGTFMIFAVGATIVVAGIRLLVQRSSFRLATVRTPRRFPWWICAGLAINAVVVGALYLQPIGSAAAISYEYDTIWHFSTIQWILNTGDGSSVNVGLLDGTAGSHFYPAAWHALVALTVQLTGSSISAAVHGSILALLLVVWPIAMATLFARLFGRSGVGILTVSAMAFLPASFPIGFLDFGVLWSNFFSMTLVPLGLIVGITLLSRMKTADRSWLRRESVASIVAVLCIPIAMLFAQPNAAFTMFVILLPLAYVTLFTLLGPRYFPQRSALARIVGISAGTIVLVVGWIALHDSSFLARTVAVNWPGYQTRIEAVGEWVFFGNSARSQIALGVLAVVGIVLAVVARRSRWFAVSYGVLGLLFLFASSVGGGTGSIRDYLVGFWYHDSPRLAATGAIVALPFIGYAVHRVVQWLTRLISRAQAPMRAGITTAVTATAIVLCLVVVTGMDKPLQIRAGGLSEQSQVSNEQWLSPNELSFLSDVAKVVGPNDVIANNPFDGSAMAYSLGGLNVLFPALPGNWMGKPTADQTTVIEGLNRAASDPAVCAAAQTLDIRYVMTLENGARGVFQNGPDQFPGLAISPSTEGFNLVLRDGPLALYRMTECESTVAPNAR